MTSLTARTVATVTREEGEIRMSWETIVHNCMVPSAEEIVEAEATEGSIWRCVPCGSLWGLGSKLTPVMIMGGTHRSTRWQRLDLGSNMAPESEGARLPINLEDLLLETLKEQAQKIIDDQVRRRGETDGV